MKHEQLWSGDVIIWQPATVRPGDAAAINRYIVVILVVIVIVVNKMIIIIMIIIIIVIVILMILIIMIIMIIHTKCNNTSGSKVRQPPLLPPECARSRSRSRSILSLFGLKPRPWNLEYESLKYENALKGLSTRLNRLFTDPLDRAVFLSMLIGIVIMIT